MMKKNNLMERENTIVSANHYEAPTVRVIEVAVEKGYALSGEAPDSDDSEFGGASASYSTRTWGNLWE